MSSPRSEDPLATYVERLNVLHEVDRAIIAGSSPVAVAEAVIERLRDLLGVPRAIVNLFDFATGEAEWLAAAGRHRVHLGPGVRFPLSLMGDVDALARGEVQVIDVAALPSSVHAQALLASDVLVYMVVPMIARGELIGGLSFGGPSAEFPPEQVGIAREAADQLAIAIVQSRLYEQVRRQTEDLEERVRERTELAQRRATELMAANKELEAFSYSVSHDLRAPLRAADGYAKMLEEDYGERLDAEGRRLLGVVRSSVQHMGQLIDDLLAFSRLGRQTLRTQRLNVHDLVRQTIDELRPECLGRTVDFVVGDLGVAEADPASLKQALANLLGNAIKFTRHRERAIIEVGCRPPSGAGQPLTYYVKDNGAGFDTRYADKLFGVFQRLHRAEEFEGTGVGLAIVQRVIERHGGRVWADATLGEGATFSFTLPAPAAAAGA